MVYGTVLSCAAVLSIHGQLERAHFASSLPALRTHRRFVQPLFMLDLYLLTFAAYAILVLGLLGGLTDNGGRLVFVVEGSTHRSNCGLLSLIWFHSTFPPRLVSFLYRYTLQSKQRDPTSQFACYRASHVVAGEGALPDNFLESVRMSIPANLPKLMARLLSLRVVQVDFEASRYCRPLGRKQ